jgi:hypothetical protein
VLLRSLRSRWEEQRGRRALRPQHTAAVAALLRLLWGVVEPRTRTKGGFHSKQTQHTTVRHANSCIHQNAGGHEPSTQRMQRITTHAADQIVTLTALLPAKT